MHTSDQHRAAGFFIDHVKNVITPGNYKLSFEGPFLQTGTGHDLRVAQ